MITPIPVALQVTLLVLCLIAAAWDVQARRIPNALVLSGAVSGFVLNFLLLKGAGFRSAALGLGLGFVLYFPLWLLHARGAGDVKLLAAMGSIAGPANTLALFCLAAVLGGVAALILVLWKGQSRQTLLNIFTILNRMLRLQRPDSGRSDLDVRSSKGIRLPHAPVLAASAAFLIWRLNAHA